MHKLSKAMLLVFPAMTLVAVVAPAAGPALAPTPPVPAWTGKAVQQWSEEDAKQVLAASPWVSKVSVGVVPPKNEDQRRQSGNWIGVSQGVGVEALNPATLIGTPAPGKRRAKPITVNPVEVRWESAAPVRAAEQKAHDTDAPVWDGNFYVLAVYDVPGLDVEEKALLVDLKRTAGLTLQAKKTLKPVRVECLPQVGGLATLVYYFPRMVEITPADNHVEFHAQFGRLSLTKSYDASALQFGGKLEL